MTMIDTAAIAEAYDDALRWLVESRRDPHVKYLVEIDSFSFNGACDCPDFQMNRRDYLARRITPEEVHAKKLLKLQPYHTGPHDILRCYHIMRARDRCVTQFAKAVLHARNHL